MLSNEAVTSYDVLIEKLPTVFQVEGRWWGQNRQRLEGNILLEGVAF